MRHLDSPFITLHGAWRGEVGSSHREFNGQITASDVAHILVGTEARVTYMTVEERKQDAAEHGVYLLTLGDQSIKLIRFTCRSAVTTGKQGTDDTEPADWQAVPLPE